MKTWSRIRSWWRAVVQRSRSEKEMDAELRFHIDAYVEDLVGSGVPRREALRRARIEFGGIELTKEECRGARGLSLVDSVTQDVRYAMRMLRKNPGFTAVAVLTLALGIGLNSAIFGLVDAAFLRALPFREPQRLVHVWTTDAGGDLHTPLPTQYVALRKYSQVFEQIAGVGWVDNFYGDDQSGWQNLQGLVVSPNWLTTLGVQPLLGRDFVDDEERPGRDAVIILSYSCWRNRFRADRGVVGSEIVLNRRRVTVIGVLPQSLEAYNEYDGIQVVAPLVLQSYLTSSRAIVSGTVRLRILARLKPGLTLSQARSETEGIAEGLLRSPGTTGDRSGHLVVEDFAEGLRHIGPTVQNARRGLWMTMVAAGVVLLIACANVASLLLARGVRRRREVAVRSALGCSRRRMVRQLLTESTLLFVCGAGLGLVAARWSEGIITGVAAGIAASSAYLEVNARVLVISLGVALLCALVFGMIPALFATRVDVNDSLKDGALSLSGGSGSRRPRNLLVIFQIALGMVLLVGFGLLFRSLVHAESAVFGFDPQNVITASATLPVTRYADSEARRRLMQSAVERARSIPGVVSVGVTDALPMNGADSAQLRIQAGSPQVTPVEDIYFVSVSPEYFSTLKIPMLAGRAFLQSDAHTAKPVAIVNQTFAKKYFPGLNPVGYHVAFADSPTNWKEIVGVVGDFRQRNPEEDLRPMAYFPVAQTLPGHWSMVIRARSASDAGEIGRHVSALLRAGDPQLYWEAGSMQRQIDESESITLRRPIILLLASFGGLALVLVVVGVFGVTSYSVGERTKEIGIRVALGAARGEIAGLVLRESVGVALLGLAIGSAGAFGVARFFPTQGIGWSGSGIYLYGVSRTDALTYSLAALLLTSVVVAASWLPARRAMRVDPVVALRYE